MGAGASAEVAGKIKDASPEQVSEVLSGLPAEKKAELQAALGNEAADEAESPYLAALKTALASGAAEEEKAAPAEAPAEAAGAEEEPVATAAPYLSEAFKLVADGFKRTLESAMTDEYADAQNMETEMIECMAKCHELLGKSFDHHDKAGNGVLDKEEAAVFFKHLLGANGAMMETIVETGVRIPLEKIIKDIKASTEMGDEEKAAAIAETKTQLQEMVDAQKAATASQMADYKDNKAERDAKAFKVVDTSGDGTLQRGEFMAALEFGSEKNQLLMSELGFPSL